jgi:hypothetical protein
LRSNQRGFILVDLIVTTVALTAAFSVMLASYGAYFAHRALQEKRIAVRALSSVVAELTVATDVADIPCPDGFQIVLSEPRNAGSLTFRTCEVVHGAAIVPPLVWRQWAIPARR